MCVGVKLIELEFSRTRPKYVKAFSSKDHWIERSGVHVRYCEKKKSSCETRRHDSLNFNHQLCSLSFEVVVGRILYSMSTFRHSFHALSNYMLTKNRRELKKKAGNRKQEILFCLHSKEDLLPNLRATSNHKCSFQHQSIMVPSTLNALYQTFTGIVCS